MTTKSNYEPQEWARLLDGVFSAGLAVSMAEPSGLVGMLQEGFASAKDLAAARKEPTTSELIIALVSELDSSEGRSAARNSLKARVQGKSATETKAACIAAIRDAAVLVDAKAPLEAAGYKAWLLQISQHVAEAAKEGGFLGFGGVAVSDNERAALSDISHALGI